MESSPPSNMSSPVMVSSPEPSRSPEPNENSPENTQTDANSSPLRSSPTVEGRTTHVDFGSAFRYGGNDTNLPQPPRLEETLFVSSSPLNSSPRVASSSPQLPRSSQPLPDSSPNHHTSSQSRPSTSPPDSSPLSFPSSSSQGRGSQFPSSSSSRGSSRSDRDTRRTIDRSRSTSRRGEFAMSSDPMSERTSSELSMTGHGDPERVIWGTTVSISETLEVFRKFLSGFKPRYRQAMDGQPLGPDADENIYMNEIDQMRQLGTTTSNSDVMNSKAYPLSVKLYDQLKKFPQELIPIMDNALKMHIEARVESDSTNPIAESNEIEGKRYCVRPYGLPSRAGLRELNPSDIDQLVTIKGLVSRATPVIPDMGDAFFQCAVCNHTTVAVIEKGTITEPTRCPRPACGQINSMQLIHNRCKFNDKQVVKLQETPDVIPDGQTPHTVSLCVYDDLVDYCKSGDRIEVTGIFRGAPVRSNPIQRVLKSLYKTYVDVVHIKKENPKRLGVDPSTRDDEIRVFTDEEVQQIKELASRPDIFDLLSRSLAPSIYENEDVKKGILLQLFGGTNKTFHKGGKPRYRGDINILLCGDPSTSKSQLLTYVHRIAPRGMYTSGKGSSAVGLTAYVTKDTETKQLVLESGALVLSDGGVCCIDEFDKMSDSTRSVSHEVMEQQTVSIAKAGIITTLNARTSILASANPIGSRYDPKLPVVQNIDSPPTLLSRFDLVYLMLDKVDANSDRRLAQHLTSMYSEDAPENGSKLDVISVEMLAKYVSYVKQNIHPHITPEAKDELVRTYVQMRSLGESPQAAQRRITATTRQLESMIRLSEAHAKMRLSPTVDLQDVVEAARLIRSAIKEYATDPTTGTIDMDLVQTGHSRAQRDKSAQFKMDIINLLDHNPTGLPYEEIISRTAEMNVDKVDHSEVALAVRELQQEGMINIGARRLVKKTSNM